MLDASRQLLDVLLGTSAASRRAQHLLSVQQHMLKIGQGDSQPRPYLIGLDRPKYGAIQIPAVTFRLLINAQGKVTSAEIEGSVGPDLERLLLEDAAQWLFLPAVKEGQACECPVQLPIAPSAG